MEVREAELIEEVLGPASAPSVAAAALAQVRRSRRFRNALLNAVLVRELMQGPRRNDVACSAARRNLLTAGGASAGGAVSADRHLALCDACGVVRAAVAEQAAWSMRAARRAKFAVVGVAAALVVGLWFLPRDEDRSPVAPGAALVVEPVVEPTAAWVAAARLPAEAVSPELRRELAQLAADPRFSAIVDVLAVELLEGSLGKDPQRGRQALASARNRLKLAARDEERILNLPEKLGWLLYEGASTPDQRKFTSVLFGSATDGVRLARAVRAADLASEHDALNALLFKLTPETAGFDRRFAVELLRSLRSDSEALIKKRNQVLSAITRAFPDDPEVFAALESLDDPSAPDLLRVRSVFHRAQILVDRGEPAKAKALVRKLVPFVASPSESAGGFAVSSLRRFVDAELVAEFRTNPFFAERVELLDTLAAAAKRNAQSPASSRPNGRLSP